MGIDIQKQLDLHPYSDQNVVTKPAAETRQTVQQPVDEEKSNAAKWMIGLTASATIVLGGLYAAKKGHLGEGAEKWAKKLFGEASEAANSGKSTATSSSTSLNSTDTTIGENNIPPVLAFITPALIRGKIKNPKFKFNDLVQELENANIKFTKTEATELIPKAKIKVETGVDEVPWFFRFDKDGVLTSIRKGLSSEDCTVYKFDNGILSSIKQRIAGQKANKPFEHILEFAENGKLKKQSYKFNLGDENIHIESIANNSKLFRNADDITNNGEYLVERLGQKFDELPEKIHGLRFKIQDRITSPKIEYLKSKPITTPLAKNIKSSEIVEAYIPRSSKYFDQAVQELDVVRRSVLRSGNEEGIDLNKVLEHFRRAHYSRTLLDESIYSREKITSIIEKYITSDKKLFAEIMKLVQKDMGEIKGISFDNFMSMIKNYKSKLKVYGITKAEHVAIVAKPLKDCSYDEFEKILKEVAPQKAGKLGVIKDPWKNRAQEQKQIIHTIKHLTGRSNIDENSTLLEILQDL